jgi:hypothetical protein
MYYDLSPTHLCWKNATGQPNDPTFHAYNMTVEDNSLYVDPGDMDASLEESPSSFCNKSVLLFPAEASHERTWLALSSDFLYEASTPKLEDRREIVEHGLECSPKSNEKEIYELDCGLDLQASCRHSPSLPFRRVSQYELRLSLSPGREVFAIRKRQALSRLVGSNTIQDAVFFASMRLLVLLIVAFVVFNRAERVSSSAFSTINSAVDVATGKEKRSIHTWFDTVSDAAVGALAIISRALIVWHQSGLLMDDGSTDVVVWECIGISVSTAHFFLRNFVLKVDLEKEAPLSKLGGSMSLADACVAALLSVVSTPMLGASARDFDAVSRLFCGVLIALFCFHRLFFSVAACSLLAATTTSDGRFERSYSVLLFASCVMWMLQTASVSFSFARLFVVPQAFSLVRFNSGGPREMESAILLGSLVLSVPYLNSVSLRLIRRRAHTD